MLDIAALESVQRIVAIDIETTGSNVLSHAEVLKLPKGMRLPGIVIQVGCIELLRDGSTWKTGETWETLVNPDAAVKPQAVKIHGIHPGLLRKAPRFPEIVGQLETFVGDSPLLAHSAFNEIDYLNYEMRRAKLAAWDEVPYHEGRFADTQQMGAQLFPGASKSLDTLLDRLWVDRSDRFKHHGALLDAELTAEAFIKIAGGFVQDETRVFSV